MKLFTAIPVVSLLLAMASADAQGAAPAEVERYDVKLPQSSMPAGGARTVVGVDSELVKSVVVDYAHYSGFISRFEKSRIVGRSGDKTDVYIQVPILKGAAKIWAIVRFDPPKLVGDTELVVGRMIKGNVKRLDATWHIRKVDASSTELKLELLIQPDLPVPDSLILPEVRYAAYKAVAGTRGEAEKRSASR